MRVLLEVHFPHAEFNEVVRDGSAGDKIARILDELKPEVVYFTEFFGQRGAVLVVNLDDPAQIPRMAEPFFLLFDADVEFHIVMTPDDLKRSGLEELGRKWT